MRSVIFNSPNCAVACLSIFPGQVLPPSLTPTFSSPRPDSHFRAHPLLTSPGVPQSARFVSSVVPFSPFFSPSNVPSLPGIRSLAGWQADGTDEDGRDWLIPNLLSPCHSGPQRSEGSKREREKERERVMEPARWSQLSDGESFMVLRTQQLHRARLHGSALLSIFLVGSRCRPSCVYPGFVLSCSPTPLSTSTSYFAVPSLLRFLVARRLDVVKNPSTSLTCLYLSIM